ncbi:type I glyceraldehyde-3-phosphate dehydrogenase [Thermodesulforhabdus norvegica]|uniref:Glyceraldehyde-3-phosphate dehydrogenase n=1 Tax=Thermodesulforhabdus norvegica TaxID=39841 RepID=A0A1I4VJP9_9BACT|nr:type I glyceraldehyde-3-phosphate dehydrogenase [Thermodesulforhabdus norvegica]SFN01359.1 glyceraldehyde-3-phosphate dehydrogenase (NAD+) [Thermodesulforhabdus norvegica]
MAVRVAINGFGRIGRMIFRANLERKEPLEVVALNDLGSPEELAYLLKYDSVHGTIHNEISAEGEYLVVDGKKYRCCQVANPADAPWKDLGVDIVLETSGRFRDRDSAQKHIDAGAKKVIVGAPGKKMDATFVMGVNHEEYDPRNHHIVSNASCTTNCLAPIVRVLHDHFGIVHGLMTTVHSYTMDQRLLDALHKDRRRARAAALSMVPTTTGAAVAVAEVIPELKGRLDGLAIRVPTPNVSLVDFVCEVEKETSVEEVNQALEAASQGPLKGILHVEKEELVSCDFNHSTFSSIVDAALTRVIDGKLVKVMSWYDNEFGYSNRMIDLALHMGKDLE